MLISKDGRRYVALEQTFPAFHFGRFAVPSLHLCFTQVAVNVINLVIA